MSALLSGIYTLTPTHVGTGEADLTVDLPVAKDSHTGLPFLPGSGLKGVARAACRPEKNAPKDDWLKNFGSEPPGAERVRSEDGGTSPGALRFSDGLLLAWPARSLNAPTVWITSPLLIERVDRLLRAHNQGAWLTDPARRALAECGVKLSEKPYELVYAPGAFQPGPLVLEDLCLTSLSGHAELATLAKALSELLPDDEPTAERLKAHLVLLSDHALQKLVHRAIPIVARVQLTDGKTTSDWGRQKGNLWYEEVIPPDTLFAAVIAVREDSSGKQSSAEYLWKTAATKKDRRVFVQIGGNETVGQGMVWWTHAPAPTAPGRK